MLKIELNNKEEEVVASVYDELLTYPSAKANGIREKFTTRVLFSVDSPKVQYTVHL